MSRIVHLSDLHLGKPTADQYVSQDKSGLFGDRATTKSVLKDTLRAFHNSPESDDVAAVVVSGDLTNHGKGDGYREFADLAQQLPQAANPERIVVVPGNHDIVRGTEPGSHDRYEHWIEHVRGKGFVTPLLDGLDFAPGGKLRDDELGNRRPVLEDDDFVIVALNSSNFCGMMEGEDVDWKKALRRKKRREMLKAIDALRLRDVPRISGDQMRALDQHFLENHERLLDKKGDERVRIAVLHHHLLPVSPDEEFKAFESILNLGEVRRFLRDWGFHVVLHGHKHQPAHYFDYLPDPSAPLGPGAKRMVVVAAPGRFRRDDLTFRLLDVDKRAHFDRGEREQAPVAAPLLDIRDVPGLGSGEEFRTKGRERVDLWRSDMELKEGPFTAIYGDTRDEVYERLQSYFDPLDGDAEIHDLLCVVRFPTKADERDLPSGYPRVNDPDEGEWFGSLVGWWQRADSALLGKSKATRFNHGQRLYGADWKQGGRDAVERAVDALRADPHTTRSFAVLVDPRTEAGSQEREYPAFVVAQLRLVKQDGNLRLDCTGYFRKQDIRHWWPINVAELARIQSKALTDLKKSHPTVERGQIATFASTALVDDTLPSLDVARIDRVMDGPDGREDIWRMAYAVFHPKAVSSGLARELWEKMLLDLAPGDSAGPRIASLGLDELVQNLKNLTAVTSNDEPATICRLAEELRNAFKVLNSVNGDPGVEQMEIERIAKLVPELHDAVERRLANPSS